MRTCSTEGDEGLRVPADERQLVLGEGQPVHDVLDEVVWDDRRNVPPQLSENHQFPVLWSGERQDQNLLCVGGRTVWRFSLCSSVWVLGGRTVRRFSLSSV